MRYTKQKEIDSSINKTSLHKKSTKSDTSYSLPEDIKNKYFDELLNFKKIHSELSFSEPESFDVALDLVESLKIKKAFAISTIRLETEQAQRVIDFVTGATYALDGEQNRFGKFIFVFKPLSINSRDFFFKENAPRNEGLEEEAKHPSRSPKSEVVVIEPKSFDEALDIVEELRCRKSVILNLLHLDVEQSQRIVDFLSGATHALNGHQQRFGQGSFIFAPDNFVINSESVEARALKDAFWGRQKSSNYTSYWDFENKIAENRGETTRKNIINEAFENTNISRDFKTEMYETIVRNRDELSGKLKNLANQYIHGVISSVENYSTPKDDNEQVKQVSDILKILKDISKLTADEVVDNLPDKYKISRTAFNAYLYGTIKTPPTRESLIALLSIFSPSKLVLNLSLMLCGYSGIDNLDRLNPAKQMIFEIASKKSVDLTDEDLNMLAELVYSMTELQIEKSKFKVSRE